MSVFASPRFLPRVLWADAASCLASGLLQLAAIDALPSVLGLPQPLLLGTGIFLLAYAAAVGWLASRPQAIRPLVALFAIGNAGWAAGCLGVALAFQPTGWGLAWLAMQAACVLVLADLQWLGLRAGRRSAHLAAA